MNVNTKIVVTTTSAHHYNQRWTIPALVVTDSEREIRGLMYKRLILPSLSILDPESAHSLSIRAANVVARVPLLPSLLKRTFSVDDSRLNTNVFGLDFKNPIGLAAGFDKTGTAITAMSLLGFGHIEVGTVTPLPQAGHPRPRMFRLRQDHGIINRIGFANRGCEATHRIVAKQGRIDCVVGMNIGPNAQNVDAEAAAMDCATCFRTLYEVADYFVINISSPNTQGLRQLQSKAELQRLLTTFFAAIEAQAGSKPVLLKISPDFTESELSDLVEVSLGFSINGFIASNTTVTRPDTLRSPSREIVGGLSGAPVRDLNTSIIRMVYRLTKGAVPIIGVGGVSTVGDAVTKLRAGASLIQIYTGLIYEGPSIIRTLNRGLLKVLEEEGLESVQDLVGTE